MEETKQEQTMYGLEEPPTDFTEKIQEIFDSIPLSVQNQYKKALTKKKRSHTAWHSMIRY